MKDKYSYVIDCIATDKSGNYINKMGGYYPNGSKWSFDVPTIVAMIENGNDFFVKGMNGETAHVYIVEGENRKFLRTEPDSELENNLLKLPNCNKDINNLSNNGKIEEWNEDGTPPARDINYKRFKDLSVSDLWQFLSNESNNFHLVITLKRPNLHRGFFNGKRLISIKEIAEYKKNILEIKDIAIPDKKEVRPFIMPDGTKYPSIIIRTLSKQALSKILSLDFVDSVSPLYYKPMDSIGCALPIYNVKDSDKLIEGNLIPWTYKHLRIEEAWGLYRNILPGKNIRVGVIDTGVFENETQLTSTVCFNNRPNRASANHYTVVSKKWDDCGHGTRISGIISAPFDGGQSLYQKSIVGIAWGAGLTTVKCAGGVLLLNGANVANAINMAVNDGAKIINLALGSPFEESFVHDTIMYHYNNSQVIFVAAAGTSVNTVVFPAWMNQTLAVGVVKSKDINNPNARYEKFGDFDQSAYGKEVDVVSINDDIGMPTTGGLYAPVTLGGSSSGTAHLSGVLALIWGMDTNASRDVVLNRLFNSCSNLMVDLDTLSGYENLGTGRGIPDAYLACGGFRVCFISIDSQSNKVYPNNQYTLRAFIDGWMPVNFQWNTGEVQNGTTESQVNFIAPPNSGVIVHTVTVTHPIDGKKVTKTFEVIVSPLKTLILYSEEVIMRGASFLNGGRYDVIVNEGISMPLGCVLIRVLGQYVERIDNKYMNRGMPRETYNDGARGFTVSRQSNLPPERLDANLHLWHDGLSGIRVRIYYEVGQPEGIDANVPGHTVDEVLTYYY